MTIKDIIEKEKWLANEFQRVVDTHMVNENWSIEEMYCDDTEVIEEHLVQDQEWADYHRMIAECLEKYQKIEGIIADYQK